MVHHRQGLPLGLEAGDHLLAVHARLDDLQRHQPAHRPLLLGHIDEAHAPFADLLQQLVGADEGAARLANGRRWVRGQDFRRWLFKVRRLVAVTLQQIVQPTPQVFVRSASGVEKGGSTLWLLFQSGAKQLLFVHCSTSQVVSNY